MEEILSFPWPIINHTGAATPRLNLPVRSLPLLPAPLTSHLITPRYHFYMKSISNYDSFPFFRNLTPFWYNKYVLEV